MDAFCRNPNRTVPVAEDGPQRADVPLCSRTNGWSWPPHPFQLLAWLLYVYFAVTSFGVFVPLLPAHWMPAGYIVSLRSGGRRWTRDARPTSGERDVGAAEVASTETDLCEGCF